MADKRMTEEDVVAELRDGMTIGIGGWGSRRKPMAIVRAILRSDLKDLTVVAYGGPDVGMLCAAGKVRKAVYGFVSLDSIPLEPHFRAARQNGTIEAMELDEGMLQWGLRAAAMRVDFLPCRAGLGSAITEINPGARDGASPYGDRRVPRDARAHARRRVRAREPRRRARQRAVPRSRLVLRRPVRMAAERTFVSCERIVEPGGFLAEGPEPTIRINRMFTAGVVEAPYGAHFTHCVPDYQRDEAIQKEYADSAKSPEAWDAVPGEVHRHLRSRLPHV